MPESASEGAEQMGPQLVVDPEILANIGSPARPEGVHASIAAPPKTLPGELGAIAAIKAMYGSLNHGVGHDERMRARHGEIYRTMYLAQPMVAVSAPDEIQKILRNEHNIWSSAIAWDYLFFDGLNVEGGNPGSLLTLDFDVHRSARKLMQPVFSSSAIRGYIELARPLFERSISRWIADGQVNLSPVLQALFPSISNRLLTGIEDPAQLDRFDRSLRAIAFGGQALVSERYRFLNPSFIQARRAYGYLTDYFVARAPQRRAHPSNDLFSQLCLAAGGPNGMSDHALVRSFLTMMLGAHDSTALGIINATYLLAKHPEWQERVREEARNIQVLDWGGLQKLEQLDWVWKESLRLIPVTPYVPRRALRDVEMLGHQLKAGTLVGPLHGVAGRHPDFWKNPLEFDPERFSPERSEHKAHPAIYNPFGGGAHVCIGMQLATLEAKVLFHNLLTRCRFELQRDYEPRHTWRPLGCVSGKVGLRLVAQH
jgi:cytochrome P450